ncbi:CASP8 and FADD-like apoptosis regulator isoform X1 [Anguilla anguilla]|uniref:CASP8 and FADD-like apoptosis regulator isoform X1 n=1 Tax=Anguilla anguilla TaxID=7936 RepID=UPI0015AF215C|nr:CASP8 and FADD-like apoptosis regulator isoform X1 [Anguilla anguilla]XP_035264665.1 CASP8 and FADD-like apoptosis regulator isoform X1 [Anguilla anguilla]XP_035264666.1 CASP8 and FADD-like apoptosis regulator isoform X1 [Anguilla anguilla]XP_035264667.1 CASP8 and FADD-like apoptosis regulator isoform X1 [Anguilla anguilla]XP_035264668.1 CASP8 and FADD-like apoptosis regulator isoform X1 [Anguilla anguilla]
MANGQLTQTINEIAEELTSDECKRLFYLCGSLDTDKGLDNVRGMLKSVMNRNEADHMFLPELMFRIRRYDILKKILHTNKKEVERILGNGCHVSEYRVLMTDISEALGEDDLQSLIFLLNGTLPKGRTEKSTSFLDVVVELEKLGEVSCENVELIERCLRRVHRVDLAKKIQRYQAGGQSSLAGINVCRPAVRHQCANDMPAMTSFVSPGLHNTWQCMPKPQAAENMQFSVPETGWHYSQSSPEVYRMWADPRGTCVIIDCVGSDGDMLEQTFSQLHFRVVLCKWPSVEEVRSTLMEVSRRGDLQGDDAFVCCIVSRATSTHLLATELEGPGLRFDAVRRLFSTEACLGLAGKPKLFFIQSYSVAGLQSQRGHGDEDLETDWPVTACAAESVPTDADIFWSLCRTSEWQLQYSGHRSVYLRALSAALLKGQERKLSLLDVHTEVNAIIYERPQSNPGEAYSISLQHTLRKTLFI